VHKVYFVGCGPGDPDLITVKAKKLIQKADVVVYSGSLIPPEILKLCKKAKTYDAAKLVREEINELFLSPKKSSNAYIDPAIIRVKTNDIISFPNQAIPCQITTPIIKDLSKILILSVKGKPHFKIF